MRLVRKEFNYWGGVTDVSDGGSTLEDILYRGNILSPFKEVLTLIL